MCRAQSCCCSFHKVCEVKKVSAMNLKPFIHTWHWSVHACMHTLMHACMHTLTHSLTHSLIHSDCSENWVLILVGMKVLWEEESFQLLKGVICSEHYWFLLAPFAVKFELLFLCILGGLPLLTRKRLVAAWVFVIFIGGFELLNCNPLQSNS